jgi:hypothetical protein
MGIKNFNPAAIAAARRANPDCWIVEYVNRGAAVLLAIPKKNAGRPLPAFGLVAGDALDGRSIP